VIIEANCSGQPASDSLEDLAKLISVSIRAEKDKNQSSTGKFGPDVQLTF